MKEGINLAPPPGRWARALRAIVVLALLGAGLQSIWYVLDRARVAQLRLRALAVAEGSAPVTESGVEDEEVLRELHAATLVGATSAIAPTKVLRFAEAVLPPDVVLTRLDLDEGRPTSLTLTALARNPEAVGALQKNVEGSPLVVSTELLEERRMTASGELTVRLQVELSEVLPR